MIVTPPPALLGARIARKWRRYPSEIIPAWIADMDFAPAAPIAATLLQAIALGDLGYGPVATDSGVPEAFATWAGRRWGWSLDPADVMLMPDVVGGIANCVEALTAPGDAVLVHTPAYPPLLNSVTIAGRRLVTHRLEPGAIDFTALDAVMAERRVRMLLLCHPHNPSGRVFTEDELRALAGIAERRDLVIVSDEVHADLTLDRRRHIPFATLPGMAVRTITLNSPSKAFNVAGLRTAVCVAEKPLRERLTALPSTRWNAFSTLGVRAARAAWSDEGAIWLDECVAHLAAMRDRIGERLPAMRIGWIPPQASYLAWLDCRAAVSEEPAAFFLREARVALSPGLDFGAPGAGFVRLNFATSIELLDEILDRMEAALSVERRAQ
ncbi:MAG: aminotransferase class I/II-fold pyridoxal phosphate-dependent enzyme [Pseudomonadota bacterium]|uniref:MalY/PatB family protein n=1 Tax=Sphingomonas sp. ERG5 TaxID=1381597 RepID=UPI00068E10C0|nr:aminotransferase class I/II-fold pyridoxal phosphate-dependent enzyme [Sphingomonas sp. ERG5]